MGKLSLVSVVLLVLAAALLLKGAGLKKDATLAASKITLRQEAAKVEKANPVDLITAKNLIESLAAKHNVPVTVVVRQGGEIVMQAVATDDAEKRHILDNYDGIMSVFSAISGLPYKMTYKSACIGMDCSNPIDVTFAIGDAPTPPPAQNKG